MQPQHTKTDIQKSIAANASCKRIKELKGGSRTGIYSINPTGSGAFDVYCDMTTDGGGWTYATMLADNSINLFETANTKKITSLTKNISTKGQITDMWIDNGDKDIMFVCRIRYSVQKPYEFPTIIYQYKKADIVNLTKTTKQATIFSSVEREAKYRNKKVLLAITYGSSSVSGAFYPRSKEENRQIIYLTDRLGITNLGYYDFASYNNIPGFNSWLIIDTNNYCMTALR